MQIPRLFSPSVTARLFDPMPLPRSFRFGKIGRSKARLPNTSKFKNVSFKVKKIPLNR